MKKIYLSKSNQSNYDDVLQIRTWFRNDFELLEHKGGKYNPLLMYDADIIIVIGHEQTITINDPPDIDDFYLGRGTGMEVNGAIEAGKKVFLYHKDDRFYSVTSKMVMYDKDDWKYRHYRGFYNDDTIATHNDIRFILQHLKDMPEPVKKKAKRNPLDDILPSV